MLSESEEIQLFNMRIMLLPLHLLAHEQLVFELFLLTFLFELRNERYSPKLENPLNP